MLRRSLMLLLPALMLALAAAGQRRVTPVEPAGSPAPEPKGAPTVEVTDARGNVVLIDTVTGLEYRDTLASRIPRMLYPTVYRLDVGVNLWDPAMRLLGNDYGGASLWAQLNMHNRYFPYLEVGYGTASLHPEEMNYRYRSPAAPYVRVGAAYNMFYNSNPAYRFLAGVRYGFSAFRFSVDDVTVTDSYWGETSTFNIPQASCTAGWLEITAGVRVAIAGNFSIGWDVIYHQILHQSHPPTGDCIYIPGYGKKGVAFSADLSLVWSFTLNKPAPAEVNPLATDQ